MQRFLQLLRSNWITASGAVIATLSFMAFLTTLVYVALHGGGHGAYLGLFAFILLPGLFVMGIGLVPIGLLIFRSQLKERMAALQGRHMRILPVIGVLTVVNLATVGTAGYEAVHYMDSQQFCGKVCHTVMSHSFETAQDAPHANIACVQCHIGPGVGSFIEAKLSGMRQLFGVMTGDYSKPIPTPVHTLRAANEICENCHTPSRPSADRLVVREHFGDDADVTPATSVLLVKIGGRQLDGSISGAHWHAHPDTDVSYISNDGRRTIDWIRKVDRDGKETIYTLDGENTDQRPPGELRRMDCIDCHNQPAHYQQEADVAVDQAIAAGRIARQLPSIRKLGIAVLQKTWQRERVGEEILADLERTYEQDGGLDAERQALLPAAAEALAAIWRRNVQPEMNVTWGTYPNYIGHGGCMRCHDGMHMSAEGNEITSDCNACHTVLADGESDPAVLRTLGIEPR